MHLFFLSPSLGTIVFSRWPQVLRWPVLTRRPLGAIVIVEPKFF